MKIGDLPHSRRRTIQAFNLVEVAVAVAITGFVFLSLYAGFSSGFAVVQLARENLRGIQIIQEKLETLRLYSWDQITSNGFVPGTFTEQFYPASTNSGIIYTGTVTIASAPITESYSNLMRQVTISVRWVSSDQLRTRDMTTFVSQYGLQNYIY